MLVRGAQMRAPVSWADGARVSLAACLLLGCADHVARTDLLGQIEAGTAPPIIDVRSRREFETSHVPGAVHVPFYAVLSGPLPASAAGGPVVVYCEHGPRAGIARVQLWVAGVGPVLFLDGHMTAWKAEERPVERGRGGRNPEAERTASPQLGETADRRIP